MQASMLTVKPLSRAMSVDEVFDPPRLMRDLRSGVRLTPAQLMCS